MNDKVKKYIKKRNNIDCMYLTINRVVIVRDDGNGIIGIIDLIEFDKLTKINCENNKISKIINICPTVQYINCKNNNISELNYLPDELVTLICDYNKIKSLDNLPIGIKFLSCDSNNLVGFENLPFGLEHLSCADNPIISLDFLPEGLTKLYLIEKMTELKSINNLPNSIEEMICTESLERMSKKNFPKDLILFNQSLGIWKKNKTK